VVLLDEREPLALEQFTIVGDLPVTVDEAVPLGGRKFGEVAVSRYGLSVTREER
jgi:hypothetical protein